MARGWIGVQTRELTPELAEALKLGDAKGVLISGVVNDAPAAKAGIKPGDVLTRIGEQALWPRRPNCSTSVSRRSSRAARSTSACSGAARP